MEIIKYFTVNGINFGTRQVAKMNSKRSDEIIENEIQIFNSKKDYKTHKKKEDDRKKLIEEWKSLGKAQRITFGFDPDVPPSSKPYGDPSVSINEQLSSNGFNLSSKYCAIIAQYFYEKLNPDSNKVFEDRYIGKNLYKQINNHRLLNLEQWIIREKKYKELMKERLMDGYGSYLASISMHQARTLFDKNEFLTRFAELSWTKPYAPMIVSKLTNLFT